MSDDGTRLVQLGVVILLVIAGYLLYTYAFFLLFMLTVVAVTFTVIITVTWILAKISLSLKSS